MKRRAIIYTRVSTDEQADRGYSLRDQEARLREYCRRYEIRVVEHFQDDFSAKTFDRPAFQRLLRYMKANRCDVDELLVVKWDRFSRDATGALGMIRTLEGYGVNVQAIEQPIDRSVPEQLMILAIYVAAPEVENRRRSLSTKAGMRRAMKEGRWVNMAPTGYKNKRDENGRASIVPDERADFVRTAFHMVADNPSVPLDEIMRRLRRLSRQQGWRYNVSRSQFHRMLRSEVYAGRIRIPAWRDEPEEVVQGKHEALIPEHVFDRVQLRFRRPTAERKWKTVPELHMRGHLLCPYCSELLTGSGSKGNGGKYYYYHCHRCKRIRVRAEATHEEFMRYLRRVQLAPEVRVLYGQVLEHLTRNERAASERVTAALRTKAKELEEKLFSVDEAYIERRIEADSYARMKERYAEELRQVRGQLADAESLLTGFGEKLEFAVRFLSDLVRIYDRAPVELRREVLSHVWPDHLRFDGREFRTNPETDIIALLATEAHKMRDARSLLASGVPCGSGGGI